MANQYQVTLSPQSPQAVNDLYSGIISPQGGLYQPGPPPMLPPQNSPQALGNMLAGGGSASGTGYGGSASLNAPQYAGPTTDATNPLDIGALGLTSDPFATNPGQQAISGAIQPPPVSPWANGGVFGGAPGHRPVQTIRVPGPFQQQPRGLGALPSSQQGQQPQVTIASGRTVPVGTTGTAQGGKYGYVVQPDGSVVNTTTGRVTAKAPGQSGNGGNGIGTTWNPSTGSWQGGGQ